MIPFEYASFTRQINITVISLSLCVRVKKIRSWKKGSRILKFQPCVESGCFFELQKVISETVFRPDYHQLDP